MEPSARRTATAVAAGAFAGASVWLSAGVLAVTPAGIDARLGALPPAWWLLPLMGVGALGAPLIARRPGGLAPLTLLGLLWLPWLPTALPSSILMWEGPLEAVLWATVLAGVAWSQRPADTSLRLPSVLTRHPLRLAAGLSLVVSLAGAWSLADRLPAGDEPHYLIITQSLLLDGDLKIENNHRRVDYAAYYDREMSPDFLRRGTDGQIYSIHAPGLPVLVLPGFLLAGHAGAVVTVALLAALGGVLAWLAAYRLTGMSSAAWVAWLGVMGSATAYFHSFTLYPDGVGATPVMAAVLLLVLLETGAVPSTRVLVAIGASLAALPWLHTRFALLAGLLGAMVALRLWAQPDRARRLAAFLVVPVVSCVVWLGMFRLIYGTFNPSAPYGGYTQSSLRYLPAGLLGLLVDQQFGVVANAPVLACALPGLLALWRRSRRLAVELLVLGVPYLLAVAAYRMWWGGFSAPGRFAAAIVLPLVLPLAAGWATSTAGVLRSLIVALLTVTLLVTATRAFVSGGDLLYNDRNGADLLLDAASASLNLPQAFPALHREKPIEALGDSVFWAVALALAWAAITVLWPRLRTSGARWAAVTVTASTVAMIGAQAVMADRITPVVTPSTSQMSFLRRWDPATESLIIRVSRGRLSPLPVDAVPRQLALATTVRVPVRAGRRPLLEIPHVPAGDYDVVVEGASHLTGVADVFVGRTGQALTRWTLEGRTGGDTGLRLRLPLDVHSVLVGGDEAAGHTVRRLMLRPRQMAVGQRRPPYALRAGGYGQAEFFCLDENMWLEPGGAWVRGRASSQLAIQAADPSASPPVLRVRNGAARNTVTLASGTWQQSWILDAGETRDVPLPAAALAPAVLTVTSTAGFRPVEVDPSSSDMRMLGVWLEVAGAPATTAAQNRTTPDR